MATHDDIAHYFFSETVDSIYEIQIHKDMAEKHLHNDCNFI